MNQSNTAMQTVDLSDLFVTKEEALDLLGDLLGTVTSQTGLFGDAPVKVARPRPKWQVDGLITLSNVCTCNSCGNTYRYRNPKLMVAMSQVDYLGVTLKSIKTSDYALLLQVKGGPYFGKANPPTEIDPSVFLVKMSQESITVANVDMCELCFADAETDEDRLLLAQEIIKNQHFSALTALTADTAPNKNNKDIQKMEDAERKLLDYIQALEGSDND
jgi:hypothetical protein